MGELVEEHRDNHSRCFRGRMSSRVFLTLAGCHRTRLIPASSLGSCLTLPCFLCQAQAMGQNIPGQSGATISPDPCLPPAASLSNFWLELRSRAVAKGWSGCREQKGKRNRNDPKRASDGLARPSVDTGPVLDAVRGAREKVRRGCRRWAEILEGRAAAVGSSQCNRTFCNDGNVLDLQCPATDHPTRTEHLSSG